VEWTEMVTALDGDRGAAGLMACGFGIQVDEGV
jgi:hypothetical protein